MISVVSDVVQTKQLLFVYSSDFRLPRREGQSKGRERDCDCCDGMHLRSWPAKHLAYATCSDAQILSDWAVCYGIMYCKIILTS